MGFEKTGWLLLNCDLITNVTIKNEDILLSLVVVVPLDE